MPMLGHGYRVRSPFLHLVLDHHNHSTEPLLHTCSKAEWQKCSTGTAVADLDFSKGGFQYAIKARVARLLRGSGGMPPQENFMIFDLLRLFLVYSWSEIAKSWTTYY